MRARHDVAPTELGATMTTTTTGLTFGVTAARLGVDVPTIRRWGRNEQVPTYRDGNRTLVPASWVQLQPDYRK